MSLMSFFTAAISPVTKLIDALHTSDDERNQVILAFEKLQNVLSSKLIDLESKLIKAKSAIIVAEAQSTSYLTSNWRPITMLVFVFIIANNYILYPYFSLFMEEAPRLEIPPDMWDLLKIGLGGYIVSRGVEKTVKNWKGH